MSLDYYYSSVDGFLLSYFETRPYPFNSSRTYPLAVELHGLTGETYPISGGTGGGVVPQTAQAAANAGFILVDLNTRTGSGWYINSKFTGPQEQDVLDAITAERALRHIGSVYLFGVSMGSFGTLTIGLDHAKMFRGLGIVAGFSDAFETLAYLNTTVYAGLDGYLLLPSGGLYPNSSAYAKGIFEHLSSLRFHPGNVTNLPLYVANGAQDVLSTDNSTLWPSYQQANDTLLQSTCNVTAVFGEPPDCTVPLAELAAEHPGQYGFRYVFEPNGPHAYYLLNPVDLFAYWTRTVPNGTYWGTYPLPIPRAPPHPLVSVAVSPRSCAGPVVGNRTTHAGETVAFRSGNYSVRLPACGHRSVLAVHTSGGVSYSSTSSSVLISSSGSVFVTYRDPGALPAARRRRGRPRQSVR